MIEYIISLIFSIGLIGIAHCIYQISLSNKLLKRNERVHSLRHWILINLPFDVYESLPTYEEMLNSSKPIQIEYWIKSLKK